MPARVRATPSTCLTCSMIPQQLAPLRAPGQPACHGEMSWQSPEGAVSVSLPRVGEGEAGPSRPVQRVLFPPPCTADAFCTRSKTGHSKVRWSIHTESQRAGNQEERRKWSFFLTLASPTMVLENVVPDFTAVGQFRKANHLPEMLEDRRGPSPSAGAEVV